MRIMSFPSLFLATLALGSFFTLSGMDSDIFKSTGKKRYTIGWRVFDKHGPIKYSDTVSDDKGFQLMFDLNLNKRELNAVEQIINGLKDDINDPIVRDMGENDYKFFYPIEWTVHFDTQFPLASSREPFEAFLKAGVPVNGYPDYSPLKDILLRLASDNITKEQASLLLEFLTILIQKGVSFDTKLPAHIGFGPDTSSCKDCRGYELLEQAKNSWNTKDIAKSYTINWHIIETDIKKVPAISTVQPQPTISSAATPTISTSSVASTPPSSASTTTTIPPQPNQPPKPTPPPGLQPVSTTPLGSTASTSAIAQPAAAPSVTPSTTSATTPIEAPIEHKPSTWLEDWCNNPTPLFAKKTICAAVFGTAALAVATKRAYNSWRTRKPVRMREDLKVTIKNNTGIDVTLTVGNNEGINSNIELASNATNWYGQTATVRMQDIKSMSFVTSSNKTPMPIKLEHYKTASQAEHADLEITLYATGRFARFWYGPYSYYAAWQLPAK